MLRKTSIEIRSSLWFVPGLLVLAALVLAVGLVEIDLQFGDRLGLSRWRPFLDAGAEGARGMLAAIASSMITVAGVAFSVTIVTLSLASTQYTPRILRNFMRDRANQFVLGVFVGIFAYCLVVLRTIRAADEELAAFVPLLAVFFAVLLALVGIGFLDLLHPPHGGIDSGVIHSACDHPGDVERHEVALPRSARRGRGSSATSALNRGTPMAPRRRHRVWLPAKRKPGGAAGLRP